MKSKTVTLLTSILIASVALSCSPKRVDSNAKNLKAVQTDPEHELPTEIPATQSLDRKERHRQRLNAFMAASNLIRGGIKLAVNPGDNTGASDLARSFRNTKSMTYLLERVRRHPVGKEILKNHIGVKVVDGHYQPIPLEIAKYANYPAGTLGRAYADFMTKNKFDPNFYEVEKTREGDDVGYVLIRFAQSHDLWHVVTGFDTTVNGEQGIQSFGLAQNHSPAAVVIMAGDLLISAYANQPAEVCKKLAYMSLGYRLGSRADLFVAQNWESLMDKPLDEVRRLLKITTIDKLNFNPDAECAQ